MPRKVKIGGIRIHEAGGNPYGVPRIKAHVKATPAERNRRGLIRLAWIQKNLEIAEYETLVKKLEELQYALEGKEIPKENFLFSGS